VTSTAISVFNTNSYLSLGLIYCVLVWRFQFCRCVSTCDTVWGPEVSKSLQMSWTHWSLFTQSNKNASVWYFVRPAQAVTCGTVAIIIQVIFLSPFLIYSFLFHFILSVVTFGAAQIRWLIQTRFKLLCGRIWHFFISSLFLLSQKYFGVSVRLGI